MSLVVVSALENGFDEADFRLELTEDRMDLVRLRCLLSSFVDSAVF